MLWLESILNDLRYALRMIGRAPLVTAVSVLSLALGIGANTAIFSVLDALLIRLLPVKEPREIVMLSWLARHSQAPAEIGFSLPFFEQLRDRSPAFSGAVGFSAIDNWAVIAGGHAEYARGEVVSGNYYAVLGVTPLIGRALTNDDDRESAAPACVISYRLWENRFGRDPSVLGHKMVIGNVPFTLVGVEPRSFSGLSPGYAPAFRIPMRLLPRLTAIPLDPNSWSVKIAVRVPRGTAEAQAIADVNGLFRQSLSPEQQDRCVLVGPGGEGLTWLRDDFRQPLRILMAAVGLLLLIACANVANLLLARAHSREKEIATRLALGAGAGRLVRQFLTESLLLAAWGGSLGILLAYRAGDLLVSGFGRLTLDVRPDLHVLAFTAGVTLLTGILFGLAPAIRAARVDVQPGLRPGTPASRFGFAQVLVVTQLAFSLVVVVGAGLFAQTLHHLRTIDLGIDIHHLTVFRVIPAASGDTNDQAAEFARRVLTRLESLPGVKSAALSRSVPLESLAGAEIEVPGSTLPADPGSREVNVDFVTARFLETMGTPLLLGRGIEERDSAGRPRVVVINEALARRYFPHESPIGRHVQLRHQDCEIVGVSRDGRYDGIRRSILPTLFASYWQGTPDFRQFAVAIRTVGNPASIAASIQRAVPQVDSNIPISEMRTEEQLVDSQLSQDRLFAALSAIFGALALLLAAIGLYGVRSYSVARRTAEIGIRMALGADASTIAQMILRETSWLALLGVGIGLVAAYAVTRFIQAMLYGIAARDFSTFAGAAVVLSAVAALAGCLPARRAARVDPMVALRHD